MTVSAYPGWQVHIEFTEGEDKITLEGPTEDVNVAREQIEAMVKDLVRCPFECSACRVAVRPPVTHRDERAVPSASGGFRSGRKLPESQGGVGGGVFV